ncbi:MAG: CcoQ/FixQ family Cbb3-type cytochrome c oxidase assembly chaperone [Alphaproteobacteria bacterium HGW-Alphaproteobacteria-16]|nr:MAG: CcoQ/FixQ family Cbb3-type cytochrome c oxidase assembly chaperone [Alphaproteobacteria bacterium HGW-Alphaproteobacteria-16]
MNYEALRHFADSWGLVFLTVSFLTAIAFALTRSKERIEDARTIPFRDEEPGE